MDDSLETRGHGQPLAVISRHGEHEGGGTTGSADFSAMPVSTPVDVEDFGIVAAMDGRSMPAEFLNHSPMQPSECF